MSEVEVYEPVVEPPMSPIPILRGLKIRIAGSLALIVGGFVFVILYLAFWGTHFPWYQNLAVVVSTIVVVPVLLIAMWTLWGISVGRRVWQRTQSYNEW